MKKKQLCKFCSKLTFNFNLIKCSYSFCKNCRTFVLDKKYFFLDRVKDKSTSYEYFSEILLEKKNHLSIWDSNKVFFLKKILKKFNKQINILDISGAPGLDAIHLSKLKKIKSYDLTEFDKKFLKNYNELEIPNSKCFYLDFDKKIFFKSKKNMT